MMVYLYEAKLEWQEEHQQYDYGIDGYLYNEISGPTFETCLQAYRQQKESS